MLCAMYSVKRILCVFIPMTHVYITLTRTYKEPVNYNCVTVR